MPAKKTSKTSSKKETAKKVKKNIEVKPKKIISKVIKKTSKAKAPKKTTTSKTNSSLASAQKEKNTLNKNESKSNKNINNYNSSKLKLVIFALCLVLGVSIGFNFNFFATKKNLKKAQEKLVEIKKDNSSKQDNLDEANLQIANLKSSLNKIKNEGSLSYAIKDFPILKEKLENTTEDRIEIDGDIWLRDTTGKAKLTLQIGDNFWLKIPGPLVPLTILVDSSCSSCSDISKNKDQIADAFPFTEVKIVDLVKSNPPRGASAVPMIIFGQSVKNTSEFADLQNYLKEIKSGFEFDPGLMRLSSSKKIIDKNKIPQSKYKGKINIITFSEFACPYCARFEKETATKIKEKFKDSVAFDFRHFIVHNSAKKASEATECARKIGGDQKFWLLHKTLFENQQKLDVDSLKDFASKIGLDQKSFADCLDGGEMSALIDSQTAEGRTLGVNGTPAFFIDDIFISGAQPFENFSQIIEEKLK